jgi:AbrB family transcriptional regulator, transcriptional pleiotropic regulator of transition state genes
MSTGMARKIDQLGRVVLPAEMRRQLGIDVGDLVEISVDDGRVVLEKVEQTCVFCGGAAELREFSGKLVCGACSEQISARGA